MRVEATRSQCQGYGTCTVILPSVFDLDDAGLVLVLDDEVTDETKADVTKAVRECPARALALVED